MKDAGIKRMEYYPDIPYAIEKIDGRVFVGGNEALWEWKGKKWEKVLEIGFERFRRFPGFPVLALDYSSVFYYQDGWKSLISSSHYSPYVGLHHRVVLLPYFTFYNPEKRLVAIGTYTDRFPNESKTNEHIYLINPYLKVEKVDKNTGEELLSKGKWYSYYDGEVGYDDGKVYKGGKVVFKVSKGDRILSLKNTPKGYFAVGWNVKYHEPVLYLSQDAETWEKIHPPVHQNTNIFYDLLYDEKTDEFIILSNNDIYFFPSQEIEELRGRSMHRGR